MKQPVPLFLLGAHKSGTTLLKSLFDGHPDMFAIPFETELMKWIGQWIYYPLKRQFPTAKSIPEMKEALVNYVKHTNTMDRDEMGGTGNMDLMGRFNLALFQEFLKKTHESLNGMIMDYFVSVFHSLMGDISFDKQYIVEKTVGNSEYAMFLKQLFPDAKFIHLVRNPYANLVSLRRYSSRRLGHYPPIYPAIDGLEYTYYMLHKNEQLLGQDYYVLKYEDLVENPEGTMKKIAAFLRVDYTQSMTEPSTLGEPWVGNSSTGEKFSGISTATLERWKNEILPLEIEWVNLRLPFILERFGYERLSSSKKTRKRNKGEPIKVYLINRLAYRLDRIKYGSLSRGYVH